MVRASVNPTSVEQILRTKQRIDRLRAWLDQAAERAGTDRAYPDSKVDSVVNEMRDRYEDIEYFRAILGD